MEEIYSSDENQSPFTCVKDVGADSLVLPDTLTRVFKFERYHIPLFYLTSQKNNIPFLK